MIFNKSLMTVAIIGLLTTACTNTDKETLANANLPPVIDASTKGYSEAGVDFNTQLQNLSSGEETLINELDLTPVSNYSEPTNSQPFDSPLAERTIYFMYDSYQLGQNYQQVVIFHAQYLLKNSEQKLILEGHADERGSREYNIALGEQRAKTIADIMRLQGVPSNQLEVVSYGEEKPAVDAYNETAWQNNRRVELIYQAK